MRSTSYQLYLVRHGLAEARGEAWPDDSKRPLTERGIARLRKSGRALARLGVTLDVVLTSPLVRARQTAEIVAGAFSPHPPLVNVDALLPGGSPAAVATEIEKHGRRRHVLIVGHEPGIGELTAWLIGSRNPIAFKKGGVCRIDVEGGTMRGAGALRWMLSPKILRALKK
jgi:phosphohistidine phosphatase